MHEEETKARLENSSEQTSTHIVAHLILLFIACFSWIIIGPLFSYIVAVVVLFSMIAAVIGARFYKTSTYKYCISFVLCLVIAPLLLAGISFTLSSLFPISGDYTIGLDIETPNGIETVINRVSIEDRAKTVSPLKAFYSGTTTISAKSKVVLVKDGKALIVLLSFDSDDPVGYLKILPRALIRSRMRVVTEDGVKKYILSRRLPLMILFTNGDNPVYSYVDKESFGQAYGDGYSFLRAWVTFDDITPPNELDRSVPWWDYDNMSPKGGSFPYHSLKLSPDDLVVHESSPGHFFRF